MDSLHDESLDNDNLLVTEQTITRCEDVNDNDTEIILEQIKDIKESNEKLIVANKKLED